MEQDQGSESGRRIKDRDQVQIEYQPVLDDRAVAHTKNQDKDRIRMNIKDRDQEQCQPVLDGCAVAHIKDQDKDRIMMNIKDHEQDQIENEPVL